MARIPDEEIERLKREIPIERLVTGFGVELKRHGANLVGRCPFHDDRTPSLIVTPETNLWNCLGKCNIGGSTIDWVMKTQGVSFRHAVELLQSRSSFFSRRAGKRPRRSQGHNREARIAGHARMPTISRPCATWSSFYHETLKELARSAAVSRRPRPHASGDDRPL